MLLKVHHLNNHRKKLQISSPYIFNISWWQLTNYTHYHAALKTVTATNRCQGLCTSRPPITRGDGPSVARGKAGPYSTFGSVDLETVEITVAVVISDVIVSGLCQHLSVL